MAETDNRRAPGYRAYVVLKNGTKNHWREIGAAWKHNSGDGFTLKLDCLPVGGADIVVQSVDAAAVTNGRDETPAAKRPDKTAAKADGGAPSRDP